MALGSSPGPLAYLIRSESFTETESPAIAMQWFPSLCKPDHVQGSPLQGGCWAPSMIETGSEALQVVPKVAILSGVLPDWLTDQAWRRHCVTIRLLARVQQ